MAQSAFQSLLKEFQIEANKPASEEQLARREAALGFALPESLRRCYLTCDGGQAHGHELSALELLSLKGSAKYGRSFFDSFFGYFPFAQNNDSNPVCVCCRSPLVGYVVLVLHDDEPRLLHRSLDGLFKAAVAHVQADNFLDTHELPADFAGPKRTAKDRSIARQLIDLAAKEGIGEEQTNALRFACDLLPDEDVAEIGALLEVKDAYVRAHVAKRLKSIPGALAKKLLKQLDNDFDGFVERCAAILHHEKIQATVIQNYNKKGLRIDPGPIHLNMDVWYAKYKDKPDFAAFLTERARFLIADKKKQRKSR